MSTTAPVFWGKSYRDDTGAERAYDLRCHLLDTTGAAYALWDLWLRPGLQDQITAAIAPGNPDRARRIVAAVAGLHDIGKATPIFQAQTHSTRGLPPALAAAVAAQRAAGLNMAVPEGVIADEASATRHEAASHAILTPFPETTSEQVGPRWVGAVVGGHHGRYHPGMAGDCSHTKVALDALTADENWTRHRQDIIDLVLDAVGLDADALDIDLGSAAGAIVVLLTGLTVLADWVASDQLTGTAAVTDLTRQGAGRAYVRRAERAYRKTLPTTVGVYRAPANPRQAVMGSAVTPLYPLQHDAQNIGRGLWIVAETTGSGKTESAMLRHMTEAGESVIWGLPTRATADKMWDRIQWMYRRTRNVGALLHAHRSLNGFYLTQNTTGPGLRYSAWATEVLGNIKPLLSPVAVGTVDQVLLGALRQKWNPVRLLAVANAHVILDEVHLMDEYQVQLVEELLTWWGMTDTRVTMLSASLPQALTQRFADAYNGDLVDVDTAYPSHTVVHAGATVTTELTTARAYDLGIDLRTHTYAEGETPDATLIRHTVDAVLEHRRAHPSARIAVIMNRVGHVQQTAGALLAAGVPDVTTMHSRMSAAHRTQLSVELETTAGKASRVEGAIVVGTQVIEASLDLDFDIIVTELAPAAALIQRAGRQWRHSRVTEGTWAQHWHTRPGARPVLTVITLLEPDTGGGPDRPGEALALPYAYGALYRTFRALQQMNGTLPIPAGVQAFVDAAHYDPTDDLEETHGTGAEIIAADTRARAAHDVIIHARTRQGPFRGPLTYAKLARLTEPDEQAETATRYADYAQVPVLVVDPFTHGQWAWRGNLDDAAVAKMLRTRAPREVAVLLGLTIQVPLDTLSANGALIPLIEPALRFDRDVTPFAASELRGVIPVRLGAGTHYDARLGLRAR
jgi:CRISPR-associated endonuclease/helicase Cas3